MCYMYVSLQDRLVIIVDPSVRSSDLDSAQAVATASRRPILQLFSTGPLDIRLGISCFHALMSQRIVHIGPKRKHACPAIGAHSPHSLRFSAAARYEQAFGGRARTRNRSSWHLWAHRSGLGQASSCL